jgi:hypothetical protein
MKRLFISCCMIALLLFPVCSSIGYAAGEDNLSNIETSNVDFDFVVLAKNQSATVSAGLETSLSFQVIPVMLTGSGSAGSGSGTFSANMSRNNTEGELVYIYQLFPGVPTSAFNIGITPVSMRVASTIPNLDDGVVFGFVITGFLFSLEEPPYGYSVSLSF